MSDFAVNPHSARAPHEASASLFMWRGGEIVLLGEREGERWILARAWLQGDRLEHVRRWSFAEPHRFSGQVRRLVMEASADAALAQAERVRALAWTESFA